MVFLFPSVKRSNSSESQSSSHQAHYTTSRSKSPRSSTSSFFAEPLPLPPPRSAVPNHLSRPQKSPKRFWAFSTQVPVPLPPIPDMPISHARSNSANSISLGAGAEVIRRPSEAARGMKQHAKVDSRNKLPRPAPPPPITESLDRELETMRLSMEPTSAPLPDTSPIIETGTTSLPVTALLRTRNSRTSLKSTRSRHPDENDRRATIRPPPRSALPPIPFSHHLLSSETRPSPNKDSSVIVTLDFACSTDDDCRNDSLRLTLEMLKRGGGHLYKVVEAEVAKLNGKDGKAEQRDSLESQGSRPDMTDGETSEESELDSEYGLEMLLRQVFLRGRIIARGCRAAWLMWYRDEYLRSLMLPDSPSFLKDFPAPPPVPIPSPGSISITIPTTDKPRARTRNQYAQQDKFPSPSSPFTSLSASTLPLNLPPRPPRAAPLTISTDPESRGQITEIRILLLRDSMPYHIIAQRLISGSFVNTTLHGETNTTRRRKVEDEARWLGMTRLAEELGEGGVHGPGLRHKKSAVLTGGQGYI